MGNLRDEQEEKQRLEKANFDLKMKVYYLEESLKRFQDGENMSDVQTDNQKIEISKLKLQLEDKQIDLEQRNLLLIKSKNAIEALKTEIERLRNENDHHHDLEDRIRRLKQLNEDIETDYRGQITQLEQQLSAARQMVDSKTIEKATSEDKMVSSCFWFSSFTVVNDFRLYNLLPIWLHPEPPGAVLRASRQPSEGHAARKETHSGPAHCRAAEDLCS